MRRHINEFIEGMPRSTNAWTCPYFIAIVMACFFCLIFGLADSSTPGSILAAGAAGLGGAVTGMRSTQEEDACSR